MPGGAQGERASAGCGGDDGGKPKEPKDDDHPRGYYENAAGTFAAVPVPVQ